MAKFYMKQKVFSLKEKFFIKNEVGEDVYRIEGKFLSLGKQLTVYDGADREVAFIKQKLFQWLPKFDILIDGVEVAEVAQQFSFFKPKYTINGIGWNVVGNFWGHDYNVMDGENVIAHIHKAYMSFGDSFEIDVMDNVDERMVLAIVIAIDFAMDRK